MLVDHEQWRASRARGRDLTMCQSLAGWAGLYVKDRLDFCTATFLGRLDTGAPRQRSTPSVVSVTPRLLEMPPFLKSRGITRSAPAPRQPVRMLVPPDSNVGLVGSAKGKQQRENVDDASGARVPSPCSSASRGASPARKKRRWRFGDAPHCAVQSIIPTRQHLKFNIAD